MRFLTQFTVVAVLLLLPGGQHPAAQAKAANTFRVFVRGADAGVEEVTLLETPEGWTLRGSGKLRAPIELAMEYWEARYDRAWNPIEFTVNITENANRWTVHSVFQGTIASSDIAQNGRTQRRTSTVASDTIILPNLIFGAYEALAARLAAAQPGAQLQAFIAPQDPVAIAVKRVTNETIEIPGRKIAARRWMLHVGSEASKIDMEVWTEGGRLLRVDIPGQMLSIVRDDIAGVAARLVTLARANDEQASIPANGFSLAATISQPVARPEAAPASGRKPPPAKRPAVLLVSGSTASERDEMVAGIPIFAQLANGLAEAGFLVVRVDERGMGQSGGRLESATFGEFAADARAVFTYMSKRKDVDPKRIAAVGYGEGGWIALTVAAQEERLAALALIATPATSGSELVLEQQRQLFERSGTTGAAQQAAIQQQKEILDAVITGKGWDALPPDIRQRVDTPLYRSFLTFDPAQTIGRVRQPLLIVQPALDREVPAFHGEQLSQLGRSRPRAKGTDVVQLAGLNHLLARATTGDVSEYGVLTERAVSPAAIVELASWLNKMLPNPPTK
ncbi:MAG TPA: alpha/beta fold hydrolase [Vicinamibacterales bacterium]|nr:alpha/beta fold hydrolase [Vicinamibacterales bacterium]